MRNVKQIATKSIIAIISLGILTYTTMIGSVLADEIKYPSAKFNQPEAKDKTELTSSIFDEKIKENKALELLIFNQENKNVTEEQQLVDEKAQLISDMTGKIYLQVKLKGQIDKEQLVFQNDKNEEFPFVIKDEKDDTIVRILIEQHMDKINMHVKALAEKKDLDNKEMVYSIHFKEKKVQHDDAKEVPSKHQNQENNQDQLKKDIDDKKDSQKSDIKERRTSLFTEKGLNDIPVQKDKVQQDSNKKIENERPKASDTLKVENSSPTAKKVENNHKEQQKHKDEKSKKEKKKVVEKEKALPAFNRDDDSKNSSQLSSDIKELDEPNHKKQYMLFAAGIVLATILLISAHLYSRKRGNQV
ncbi:Heme transporter IsdDEF, membrane component IsdD [Staphylococcus aureus]|uniref:Heme transporter IsdDEF, membrane component IsdD n=1 Tax=Staphylococcus aureus TaxID=1280 RepID=A0A8G2HXG4_STAAU|nr:iron-regulated surface determinant protein IsdD [Staphylococcus aureus]EFB50169.1 heme transporter IsdDEF, membrane component IsdD [Staphylococcus aureus subsp. aureus D139]EFC07429.1 heme transporter IsdDEF membrane component IsdD [Staphylococcus aureus subsp. aureus H19]KIT71623.1 heme ABC transporter permease [Staphylococcus aureus]MBZ5403367.1 iron-regulated surface determinant protein IsdD [Staphylococcus aureus]MBZ5421611.1 iron-regulated surface determinant protein IsdD [Staphylococc